MAALLPDARDQRLQVRAVGRLVGRLVVVGELDHHQVAAVDLWLDGGPQPRVPQIGDRTLPGVRVVGDGDAFAQVLRELLAPAGVGVAGLVADGGVADEEDLAGVPGGGDPDVGEGGRRAAEDEVQTGGSVDAGRLALGGADVHGEGTCDALTGRDDGLGQQGAPGLAA